MECVETTSRRVRALYIRGRLTHDAELVTTPPPSAEKLNTLIDLQNVSVGYGSHAVLEKLNLQLKAGEFLALVGPNGCGKTTLLKAMMGLLPIRGGSRALLGLTNPTPPQLAGKMVYVPQRLLLNRSLPLTVKEFLELRLKREGGADESVTHALKEVGLAPNLETRSIHALSGGQMQRVFIAYALIGRPRLLFLDEVTEGLDVSAQDRLFELLKEKVRRDDSSLILVSHDISQVTRYASRVICLNGHVLFDGDPKSQDFHMCMHTMYGDRSWIHEHRH